MTIVQTSRKIVPLAKQIDMPSAGGIVYSADLNGDGIQELLVLQTPGLFHAAIHDAPNNVGWNHFCLTALTQQGDILWRIGEPWSGDEPFASHGGERSLAVFDLDGNGVVEVYVIRGNNVLKLDAQSGRTIGSWPLPYDNFVIVRPACIGPDSTDRRLLVSPSNGSYEGHSHGGPTLMFDSQGQTVFNRDIFGFGHDPVARDLNDDGFDELLVGYEMLDRNGQLVWRFEPTDPADYDDMEMHVDGISLHWPADVAQRRIAYAASVFLFVLNPQGTLMWKHRLVHPQQVIFADLRDDRAGPQLFVLNKRDSLQLFDFDGKLIWTKHPKENWPHGKPEGVTQKFHLFDPCVRLRNVTAAGKDAIVYIEGGWPYAIDGHGRRVLDFACPTSSRQPAVHGRRRPDDFGAGYQAHVFAEQDVQKLAVSDRDHVWLFSVTSTSR